MIYSNTRVKVVDNSGGLIFLCIKVYGKRFVASPAIFGDIIIGSLKTSSLKKKKVKKGMLYKALVVRTKKIKHNIDGISFSFFNSGIILLNNKLQPIGNRIYGPIPKQLAKKGHNKILALAYATI
jgi:large subunit ribosomal protein L14